MPSTSAMFSVTATIEPRYLVSVGSTLLRPIAALISAMTRPISQRPMIQKAIAASTLMPTSATVVLRNCWTACRSMVSFLVRSLLPWGSDRRAWPGAGGRYSRERATSGEGTMDLGIKGRWALVCAASKGLGRGCALALAGEGVNLVITARGEEALQATAAELRRLPGAGQVIAVAGDIA